jgi:hypothetical protein
VFAAAVGAVGVPVKAGLVNLVASEVLSTLANPTIDFVIPPTVPVNVGLAIFAFRLSAVVAKAVVATLVVESPAVGVGAVGVPVNAGETRFAYLKSS